MALVLRQLLAIVPQKEELVNRKNQWGWAPLHILCSGGCEQEARAGMVAQLCQAKADVEARKRNGTTPLMAASATSNLWLINFLRGSSADSNQKVGR